MRSLSTYFDRNCVYPQYSKCEYIVINGKNNDKVPLPFRNKVLNHADYITILGSHLSSEGNLKEDLQLQMQKRFPSVTKFYNFIRAHRNAPLPVNFIRAHRSAPLPVNFIRAHRSAPLPVNFIRAHRSAPLPVNFIRAHRNAPLPVNFIRAHRNAPLPVNFIRAHRNAPLPVNFIRAHRNAPLPVKINVFKACVINSLLYNCETFGNLVPNDLERTYIKFIKCTFGVRSNTPNLILYAESGFLPIKALIYPRQLKFFRRLLSNITVGRVRLL